MALNRDAFYSIKNDVLEIRSLPGNLKTELYALELDLKYRPNLINHVIFFVPIEDDQQLFLNFLIKQTNVKTIKLLFPDEETQHIIDPLLDINSQELNELINVALDTAPLFPHLNITIQSLPDDPLTLARIEQTANSILQSFQPSNLIEIQYWNGNDYFSTHHEKNSIRLFLNKLAQEQPAVFQDRHRTKQFLVAHLINMLSELINEQITMLNSTFLLHEYPRYKKANTLITYLFRRWILMSRLVSEEEKSLSFIDAHLSALDIHLITLVNRYEISEHHQVNDLENENPFTLEQLNNDIHGIIRTSKNCITPFLEALEPANDLEFYLFNKIKLLAIQANCHMEIYLNDATSPHREETLNNAIDQFHQIKNILVKQSEDVKRALLNSHSNWDPSNVLFTLINHLGMSKNNQKTKTGISLAEIFLHPSQSTEHSLELHPTMHQAGLVIANCFYQQLQTENAIHCVRQYLNYVIDDEKILANELFEQCVKILASSDPVAKIFYAFLTQELTPEAMLLLNNIPAALIETSNSAKTTSLHLIRQFLMIHDIELPPTQLEKYSEITAETLITQQQQTLALNEIVILETPQYTALQQQHIALAQAHDDIFTEIDRLQAELDIELAKEKTSMKRKNTTTQSTPFFASSPHHFMGQSNSKQPTLDTEAPNAKRQKTDKNMDAAPYTQQNTPGNK